MCVYFPFQSSRLPPTWYHRLLLSAELVNISLFPYYYYRRRERKIMPSQSQSSSPASSRQLTHSLSHLCSCPTETFTNQELQNPTHDVAVLNKTRRSPDLEALKLWKGRSGPTAYTHMLLWRPSCYSVCFTSPLLQPNNTGLAFTKIGPKRRLSETLYTFFHSGERLLLCMHTARVASLCEREPDFATGRALFKLCCIAFTYFDFFVWVCLAARKKETVQ